MHQRKKLQTTRIKKKILQTTTECKVQTKFQTEFKSRNREKYVGSRGMVQSIASFWLKKKAKKANKAIGLDSLEVVTKNRQFPGILLVNKIGSWQKKKK